MESLAVLYIVALIVGGGLLLISLSLGGQGGAEVHADVPTDLNMEVHGPGELDQGADLAHDAGGHGLSLATWFSMQFAVYFLAMFGLIGTAMTYVAGASAGVTFASAALGGLVVGQVIHQALRVLKRSGVGSDLTATDYLNQPGRVTIAIAPARRGEVAVASRNGERFLAAVARRGDERFKVGDRVVVVGLANGVAEVVSPQEHEFLTGSETGVRS